jgi:two-component system, OmpR family, phosphate regulon sensor histidine kinase PhoR
MSKPLRVLIVEDSENDALLVMAALKKGGYKADAERVETADAMRAALSERTWDLILCDYKLPRFNGMDALALYQEAGFDIPFIIVSGNIGEETAVAAMKAGAHDYIMKDRLGRLTAAVERELKEAQSRSERRQAEAALRESEEQLAKYHSQMSIIFNSLDALVYVADIDSYELLFVNEYGRRYWGDNVGGRCWETIQEGQDGPCPFCTNHRLLNPDGSSSGMYNWEFQNTKNKRWYDCRDCSVKWIDGRMVRLEIATDITKRKQAENDLLRAMQQLQETRDLLIQSEREAVVGRLAGDVAHAILNPVSIMSSRLQFMEAETLTDQARENVTICRGQLQRVTKIIQDLQQSAVSLSKPHVTGDLREVIAVSLKAAENRIMENQIQIVYQPSPTSIPVKMDRDKMAEMMVHLILNACDAMMNTDERRLIIQFQYPVATDKATSVLLIVADTGSGIPAGYRSRVFDPFFTTKDPGKGIGLGLSVCKNIVSEHEGTIHAETNDFGGASFTVSLPLSDA